MKWGIKQKRWEYKSGRQQFSPSFLSAPHFYSVAYAHISFEEKKKESGVLSWCPQRAAALIYVVNANLERTLLAMPLQREWPFGPHRVRILMHGRWNSRNAVQSDVTALSGQYSSAAGLSSLPRRGAGRRSLKRGCQALCFVQNQGRLFFFSSSSLAWLQRAGKNATMQPYATRQKNTVLPYSCFQQLAFFFFHSFWDALYSAFGPRSIHLAGICAGRIRDITERLG